jgi:hypothetical protein
MPVLYCASPCGNRQQLINADFQRNKPLSLLCVPVRETDLQGSAILKPPQAAVVKKAMVVNVAGKSGHDPVGHG